MRGVAWKSPKSSSSLLANGLSSAETGVSSKELLNSEFQSADVRFARVLGANGSPLPPGVP